MAIVRQVIFAIDPEDDGSSTLSYATCPDFNASGYMFTCAYAPPSKGSAVNLLQETMFLGTQDAGKTLQILRDDIAYDGSSTFTATAVTAAIDPPSKDGARMESRKRFRSVDFGAVVPEALGASVYYCKDEDPSTSGMVSWESFGGDAADNIRFFKTGLANRVHLKIVDNLARVNQLVLSAFDVSAYAIGSRE